MDNISEKKTLKKIFLEGPTWTKNEEKEVLKARKNINKIEKKLLHTAHTADYL